jgi:acetolactate decarboxylase
VAGHELRCRIPSGLWHALEQRSAATAEPVAHLVASALGEMLDVDHQTIFQVSTVGALVEGVYEGAVRVGTLREHGDFGLGTFEGLDGELVAVDGEFLRIGSDGELRTVGDDVLSPYAMITHFTPERRVTVPGCSSLDELSGALDDLRTSANHFFAFRLDGSFPRMHLRAACKVPEGTPLVEATELQTAWDVREMTGTIVGFWSPAYAAHLDVPGYHLHAVDEQRRRGGHVLACSSGELTVAVQRLEQLVVALPETADFLRARLEKDPTVALDGVERDH